MYEEVMQRPLSDEEKKKYQKPKKDDSGDKKPEGEKKEAEADEKKGLLKDAEATQIVQKPSNIAPDGQDELPKKVEVAKPQQSKPMPNVPLVIVNTINEPPTNPNL